MSTNQKPEFSAKIKGLPSVRKYFRAYGAEIGQLAIAWNSLHHNLSELFELIIKSPTPKLSIAVWHSTDSDFAQRKMLRVAAERATGLTEEQRSSILWTLNKIEEQLRHRRNDAIHAPVVVTYQLVLEATPRPYVEIDGRSQSPRALSLQGKDLKREFRLYTKLADVLTRYTHRMIWALRRPGSYAWPDRPKLPHAHQKKSHRESSRRSIAK